MIKIKNFKCFKGDISLELNEGINIIVGQNDAGKSTVLEAIHLVLTGVFRGRYLNNNLTQYLFNREVVLEYLSKVNNNEPSDLPEILIEVYFKKEHPRFEGDLFSEKDNISTAQGIAIKIEFDEEYKEEYEELMKAEELKSLPIEFYKVNWYSFARKSLTSRSIPIKSVLIDVGFGKFHNGSDIYISRIVQNALDPAEKNKVAQAYRQIKDLFSQDESIRAVNDKISGIPKLSDKKIELSVDLGNNSTWEGSLITQLDDIPFDYIGKGEQAIIKTDLALSNKKSENATVILLEEPESHISHSRLNQMLGNVKNNYGNKQLVISTHSSFVSNKLGLNNLILLKNQKTTTFKNLKSKEYFEKISGYDTLRLILSEKAILVEGDSDELVIQRAYMDSREGKLPIEDGIEVISVGTSFLRFLEIAEHLDIAVIVVTDNDGDLEAINKKYENYLGENKKDNIEICFDNNIYSGELKIGNNNTAFNYNTLEPLLLNANSLEKLNKVFETTYKSEDKLRLYMRNNKTECALKIFKSETKITYPDYIKRVIL
ncbi:AAA family ATPase [Sporosarcina sp. E16_8]|uniref:ATP-dependent nuclease n=1 Tax=Sporosarcina sp. E16_8 TaxID=2789295 RepID=UPI001A91E20D|nr:AAA family ATPase [Sporosarcina sp. E16_8]MBO0589448.1 AAA family ATPase [Sporosarcina sp. E16_8]